MKNWMKLIVTLSALCLLLTACGGGGSKESASTDYDLDGEQPLEELSFPLTEEPLTLSMFMQMNPTDALKYTNYDEVPAVQDLEKKTGIKIEFVIPPMGQEQEKFNLLVASEELPDMVKDCVNWWYKGGMDAAIDDDVAIDPEPLINLYAPNFKREFLEDEQYNKYVRADDGTIISFGACKIPEDATRTFIGPMVRKDFLEAAGLEIPETIDDWTNMLRAFKNQLGIEMPLAWGMKNWDTVEAGYTFASAYGIPLKGFYQDNGEAKFAPIQNEYKELLTTLNMWYSEGLIDPDFSTHVTNENTMPALASGRAGAAVLHLSQYDPYGKKCLEEGRENEDMIPVPQPTLQKGDKVKLKMEYAGLDGNGIAITTKCQHPKEAVMWIDSRYTDEINTMLSWGIEGEHYIEENGKKEHINGEAYKDYHCVRLMGMQDGDYNDSQYILPNQHQAWDVWKRDTVENVLPQFMTLTVDETEVETNKMTDIETYTDQMFLKFVMGVEPLSNFDSYVETVKSMGIDEVVKIYNDALTRYENR